jgi:hypothetical protein
VKFHQSRPRSVRTLALALVPIPLLPRGGPRLEQSARVMGQDLDAPISALAPAGMPSAGAFTFHCCGRDAWIRRTFLEVGRAKLRNSRPCLLLVRIRAYSPSCRSSASLVIGCTIQHDQEGCVLSGDQSLAQPVPGCLRRARGSPARSVGLQRRHHSTRTGRQWLRDATVLA